ncbi:MAG: ABC transporter permease [Acidobacteriota bacterium]
MAGEHSQSGFSKLPMRLIRVIGVIVPHRLRADWRQEWEAELRYRETLLAEWDKLDWRNKLDLLRRSAGAFWDALLLQPQRLEDEMFQDLRFSIRMLLKQPGFTAIAVLTLGLGIGVNTSMFTAVQATLMRELPYPDGERLVRVYHTSPHSRSWPHSPANFLDQQAQNNVFEHMAALNPRPYNLAEPDQVAGRVRGLQASTELFPLLGIQPTLGRTFTADEGRPGQDDVVILSHEFWLKRYAGDPNIIGRALRLDGASVTVIGVMPARFNDRRIVGAVDLWRPLVFTDAQRQKRDDNWVLSIARLKPGVSLAQAQAEMNILAAKLAQTYPESNAEVGLRLVLLAESGNENGRRVVWLTMALAGFVLLIACANLSNLQFARTAMRAREFAIRAALGAQRGRLLRQLLTESLVLAFLGGLLGLLLAKWGNELLSRQLLSGDENGEALRLNFQALGFALAASTLAGLVFGLVPAWLASRADVNSALKQGSRGTTGDRSQHRLRHALVVVEVALALVLLAGAGLVVRGLQRFTVRDPGWQADGLTLGYLSLPGGKYGSSEAQRAFAEQLQAKLAALPGSERAALAFSLPMQAFGVTESFAIASRPAPPPGYEPLRYINRVTPGYFATLGMRLVTGRDFTSADTPNHPAVVIINETMARTFWPGESPLGKRLGDEDIVGVVSDVRFPASLDEPETRFQTYHALAQQPQGSLAIALRGKVTAEVLRQAVAELDPDQPVNEIGSARAAIERRLDDYALIGRLLSGFAVLGLLLAGLGLYGVIAGFVAQRTSEIGVRMALGAQLRDVLWLVVGQGLRLTLLGVVIGLIGAFGLARLLASLAPGLESNDPLTIVGVAGLLVTIALLACWLPARQAAKVDPLVALRHD